MQKDKNKAIEAFRFFFMLLICLWHYSGSHEILKHGYLGVEFFFILSGVFIYRAQDKPTLDSPLDYFIRRWKRFNPKYIISILITYLTLVFPNIVRGKDNIKALLGVFPDMFMLQSIGIFNGMGGQNKPLWYMSVLLFGGTIVYSFLFCNKRVAINIILPMICLLGYTYFNHDSAGYKIENWKINNYVCNPLLRGVCDISLGVLIGYVTNLKSKFLNEHSKVLDVGTIMSFIFVAIFCFSDIYVDNLAIFFFVVLITGCFAKTSILHKIFNSKIWLVGGSITYSMLLLHFPIIVIFRKIISNLNVVCKVDIIVYILIVLLSSLIYDILFKKVITK